MSNTKYFNRYETIAVVLDDEETFGCSPEDSYIIFDPVLEDDDQIDFDASDKKISVLALLEFYLKHHQIS
jgi:hypothetical protein